MIMQKRSEIEPFYAKGLCFSCTRCSACCRFDSGFVFLSEKDASLLGSALKMEFEEFTKAYCRWIPSTNGMLQLSLKEKTNYDCIFWSMKPDEGCQVYDKRPLQCRAFPFWISVLSDKKSWKRTAQDCPGMDKGQHYSQNTISKWLAMRQMEPIISRADLPEGES